MAISYRERHRINEKQRDSFSSLITMLFKLKVTRYISVPTVSNPFSTMKLTNEHFIAVVDLFDRKKSP